MVSAVWKACWWRGNNMVPVAWRGNMVPVAWRGNNIVPVALSNNLGPLWNNMVPVAL
jgi:hypothetical protein